MKPLSELVVVELAGSVAGAYAARLFAGFGSRVILVERPGGDPRRALGSPVGAHGSHFAYLAAGKESLVLDLAAPADHERLAALFQAADVLLQATAPGAPARLPVPLPLHVVHARVSPFGDSGPYAAYRSNEFTDFAAGGQAYLTGEPGRDPLQGAGSQPAYAAGLHAFIGIMAALRARETSGRGQVLEVSHMETMASLHQWTSVRWTHGGHIQRRIGNRYDTLHPVTIYACADGHVAISASSEDQAERLMAISGLADQHDDPRFATGAARLVNADAFDAMLEPWLMSQTTAELVAVCQEARIPAAPVPTLLELLEDPQLLARGFWDIVVEGSRPLRVPGAPFRVGSLPWRIGPAPALGEHGPLPAGRSAASATPAAVPARPPLEGIRVLDLTRVWAGPLATRILADLGAEVIKVEPTWGRARNVSELAVRVTGRYPGNTAGERPWNREGMFNKFNRNKRSVVLNLDRPSAKAAFERLVAASDVLIENYSPRVMAQLGFSYERLRELNPAIVYAGMPGYGWDGPCRDWVAYGTTLEPHAGLSGMMGYPGGGPYKSGVAWADPVAGMHAAAAVLLALHARAADPAGHGTSVELAQFEATIALIGEHILEAQLTGASPARSGNRHPSRAPQGVYRCAGEDRWLALSITSDAEWRALAAALHLPRSLASLDLPARLARHDELNAAIGAHTSGEDAANLAGRLQSAGVIAVPLLDARDLVEDPHLRARGFWLTIDHPDCGTLDFPGQPIRLSNAPAVPARHAPLFGQDNHTVFRDIAGLTEDEIARLYVDHATSDEPD